MTDVIALWKRNGHVEVAFCIGDKWWPVTTWQNASVIATWPNEAQARQWLGQKADRYLHDYGERVGWDIDAIPVLNIGS